ncbi:MAG: 7TM-DISM domain-containing protein [Saprospiraceae bacterium]
MGFKTSGIIFCICVLIFPLLLNAEPSDSSQTYVLPDTFPRYPLQGKTQILIDDKGTFTIDEVIVKDNGDLFRPIDTSELMIRGPKEVWLKASVFSEKEIKDWNLLLVSPRQYNEYISGLEYFDLYIVDNGQVIFESHTGIKLPKNKRSGDFLFGVSGLKISFEKEKIFDLYVHLKDPDYVLTSLEIRHPGIPIPVDKKGTFSQMIMLQHFALIVGIYVLFFFFYTKDFSYLYLSALLMVIFIHFEFLNPFQIFKTWHSHITLNFGMFCG